MNAKVSRSRVQSKVGAAKGRFLGIIGKLSFGIAMLFVALIAAIPTGAKTILIAPPVPTSLPATTQSTTNPALEQ